MKDPYFWDEDVTIDEWDDWFYSRVRITPALPCQSFTLPTPFIR